MIAQGGAVVIVSLAALALSLATIFVVHNRKSWRADAYPLGLFGDLPHLPEGLVTLGKGQGGDRLKRPSATKGTQQNSHTAHDGSDL